MSDLIVEVCAVSSVEKHPQADRLEIVGVKGWKTCAPKGLYKEGSKCVYFPPDSILPTKLSDELKITQYLAPVKEFDEVIGGRVRVASLRGVRSFGAIMPVSEDMEVGADVAEKYGIKKWEPPVRATDGDAARGNPVFHKYHSIENWRNFPELITDGLEVILTEKVHGMNARLGLIRVADGEGEASFEWAAGSHDVQRKEFNNNGQRSKFWDCFTPEIKDMMKSLSEGRNIVVFGELFGSGVQDMCYGFKDGKTSFRVFDICLDGTYMGHDEKTDACRSFNVPMVPVLYRGPFSVEKLMEYTDGPTTMCSQDVAGKFKGREGVVITPVKEQTHVKTRKKTFERLILKSVSFHYLARREGTEFH